MGLAAILIAVPLAVWSGFAISAPAGETFSDGFESGDLSHHQVGIAYGGSENANVSSKRARSGSRSLEFFFEGGGDNDDSWSEVRLKLPRRKELWISCDLFIPTNYFHRGVQPGNNKLLAVYRAPYTDPGFQVNFSLTPDGRGGSHLRIKRYDNGREASGLSCPEGERFLSPADRGKWISLVMHIKVPTGVGTGDAVMQLWKNGRLAANEVGFDAYGGHAENYIDELYLLGWANSGYKSDTYFYLDNLVISDSPPAGSDSLTP